MVNTLTDTELSAAIQNALQTLLPQIRAEIREEFCTGSGPLDSGGNPPPVIIHTWLERFNKQKPRSFEKATAPMCKSIGVAEKMGHPSLSHSFRRISRGGVEQENYDLLCSKVIDLVLPNISDRWCWSLEGSQECLGKSSRILIDNKILPKAEVPTRWLRVVPIKVNVHAWRVYLDKLPTRANLSLRGMDIPSIACPLFRTAALSFGGSIMKEVAEEAKKEAVKDTKKMR
nr:RNA-directed DNA polymerase, eukaryota [Tanacetum cinerariifolium]